MAAVELSGVARLGRRTKELTPRLTPADTPEPATALLLIPALFGLLVMSRRFRRQGMAA